MSHPNQKCFHAILPLLLVFLGTTSVHALETVNQTSRFLGKKLVIQVTAPEHEAAKAALKTAQTAIENAAILLNTQRTDSPMAAFNQADQKDQPALVAPLRGPLETAMACARQTDGLYDPTLGPLVELWGLRREGNMPRKGQRRRALRTTGTKHLQAVLDGNPPVQPVRIDERGLAFGWMLHAAKDALTGTTVTQALIRFGDHTLVYPDTHQAVLTLLHPVYRDRPITAVTLTGGGLGVAGDNPDRTLVVDRQVLSEVIDPRNGGLVPYWGELTVWAPDVALADCLATGLYVLGPHGAEAWLNAHPQFGGVLAIARTGSPISVRVTGVLR